MAYQSLYRRYRSQRFDEVLGQAHVTTALRNAVREGRVSQGYLFSGPRGTGKTSTARILAKVLNCDHPVDGEPDTTCDNCVAVQEGRTVDWLHELDAASNNGVDAMRDLIGRAGMGTSGNRKVYILDEVHMLTAAAANALLKTLEEPPEHVIFVLATTEPEKVLPTIRSRTQHFEFGLLPADVLAGHVRHVIDDAGLGLGEDAVDHVVRMGKGSARDTLSALDQVAAAGGVLSDLVPLDDLIDALGARDAGAALLAVDAAIRSGREPRTLGTALIDALRQAFLVAMGAPSTDVTDQAAARASEISQALGPASLTRALEAVGSALVDMRQAPDPRIPLEVALIQIARPEVAGDLQAVVRRVEALERALAAGTPAPAAAAPATAAPAGAASAPQPQTSEPASDATTETSPPDPAVDPPARGPEAARARLAQREVVSDAQPESASDPAPAGSRPTLGGVRRARSDGGPATGEPATRPVPEPAADPPTDTTSSAHFDTTSSPAAEGASVPDVATLTSAWDDDIVGALKGRAKALFRVGHFVEGSAEAARFALPNEAHLAKCQECVDEVRSALAAHFGGPVPVELVVEESATSTPSSRRKGRSPRSGSAEDSSAPDLGEDVDLAALSDAPDADVGGVAKLKDAFPGAELLEDP